jgi:hypothetical protein
MTLWLPECKYVKQGQIGFDIITTFLSALNEFTDITKEDFKHAETMWNELMDALLAKYDPDSTCGEPLECHKQSTPRPYGMEWNINQRSKEEN